MCCSFQRFTFSVQSRECGQCVRQSVRHSDAVTVTVTVTGDSDNSESEHGSVVKKIKVKE